MRNAPCATTNIDLIMGLLDRIFGSREQARNAAIDDLEERGAVFDGKVNPVHQKWGVAAGREVGVEHEGDDWWRLRHDYDPDRGPHYNAEYGKKGGTNQHFGYPGDEDTYDRNTRRPKNR